MDYQLLKRYGCWEARTDIKIGSATILVRTETCGGSPKYYIFVENHPKSKEIERKWYPLGFETKATKRTIEKAHMIALGIAQEIAATL
jgi:hypothetical protein